MNDRDRILSMRQNEMLLADLHNGVKWLVTVTSGGTAGQYSLYYYRNFCLYNQLFALFHYIFKSLTP